MRLTIIGLVLLLVPATALRGQQGARPASAGIPSIDDLISLDRVGSPVVSPNGRFVAYTVRQTNWDENEYETEIWLGDLEAGTFRQLTSGPKSSSAPAWSPDGSRTAFLSDRRERQQVYAISPDGGEAHAVTNTTDSISRFAWSPTGTAIAFSATEADEVARRNRERNWGVYRVVDEEHRMTHLRVIDLDTGSTRKLTSGAFTVGAFDWSPDGTRIAFDHRDSPDPSDSGSADISIVTVATSVVQPLITQDGPDTNPKWSPDGGVVAFETAMGRQNFYYANRYIAVMPVAGGQIRNLTSGFDEVPTLEAWRRSGLFFSATQRTRSYLFELEPRRGEVTRVVPGTEWTGSEFNLNADGTVAAYVGASATTYPEVFAVRLDGDRPRRLTDTAAVTKNWVASTREIVTWTSQDGTEIEGVLHKPASFQANRRYPLLVVIHGGPTGVSRAVPYASTRIYPIDIWLGRGAVVLEPNYRGSAGYGEKFRSLNVRNLGVGDAWDVLSGIDHLVGLGIADGTRVGVMGWSQGGYISAFLATHHSARFKAISVGAGISNWVTYYANTDIHPFTRQYLQATPWDDPEIYAKTSPMTYIKGASAPTLIQHGEADQRVPVPNAYELYQGLRDVGVTTKLILYGGFGGTGHGPTRPRSSRALMQHNLDWFDEHLFLRR